MFYKVVTAQEVYELINKVQAALDKGWKLQGGVAISGNEKVTYAQALTRAYLYDQDKPEVQRDKPQPSPILEEFDKEYEAFMKKQP